MTQTSYNNYISNLLYHYKEYSSQIEERLRVGDCKVEDMLLNLVIIHTYIDILSCVKLCEYDINDVLHCENCLSITQLQTIVTFLNEFFGVNYCIDFINGNSIYIPPGSCRCKSGDYTTTIDDVDNSKIWVSGDITSEIDSHTITLKSCDGLTTYIDAVAPSLFGVDVEGNTYLIFNAYKTYSWDRTIIYCMTININK